MTRLFGIALLGLGLAACGSKNESYSYDFSLNGCKTESHSFNSKEEMCQGLKNRELNRSCAYSMRREYFKQHECAGEFQET